MRNKVFLSLILGLGVVGFAALTPTASADPPAAGYRYHYGGAPHWHRHVTPYGVYSHYGNDPHWDHRYYGPYSSYYRGYRWPYDHGRSYYYGRPYSYSFGRPYYYRW
jgi:hypothetical protein